MPSQHSEIYIHFVWATWNRLPLIVPEIEGEVHRLIGAEATRLGCDVLAVGGVENHVHLLVKMPPTLSVSEVAKKTKAISSRALNRQRDWKWQGSYAALSVSLWDRRKIAGYIARQYEHHAGGTALDALELPQQFDRSDDGAQVLEGLKYLGQKWKSLGSRRMNSRLGAR